MQDSSLTFSSSIHLQINISLADVCEMFSLPLHEEYEISPAVRSYRAAPLKPLTESIHKALTQVRNSIVFPHQSHL